MGQPGYSGRAEEGANPGGPAESLLVPLLGFSSLTLYPFHFCFYQRTQAMIRRTYWEAGEKISGLTSMRGP